ncbi:amidohydrolase family protein [Sorangium sp. So ce1153]|uniref:amidohydrolase family protein n=1 Tax=Sorangium sp. So ce1153 TaxID=3133333 RepID=UPI003F634BC7
MSTASDATSTTVAKKRRLITADSHITVPPQVADGLPEKYRKQVPHLERRADGTYFVRPEFALMYSLDTDEKSNAFIEQYKQMAAGVKIDPDDEASLARTLFGESHQPSVPSFYPKGRLADMEKDGVVAEVLLDGASYAFSAIRDPDGAVALSRLMNDWYADTYKDYFGQFAPGITLPIVAGIPACVEELVRAAGRGLRPAVLPEIIPEKPWYLREWDPFWEACASLKVPLALHCSLNQPAPWGMVKREENVAGPLNGWLGMGGGAAEFVAMFVNSGALERHPNLHVVFTELHAGWLGWAMQALDYYTVDPSGREHSKFFHFPLTTLKELPSYYIQRQISCTFQWDPFAIKNRHETGLDCLIWGNDYPHAESTWPDSQTVVEKQFAGVPEDEIAKIVHDNAAKLYRFAV